MVSPDPVPSSSGRTISVDLSRLAIDNTTPAAGDEVTLQNVTARVVSVDGKTAQVEVVAIDGEPLAAEPGEPTDEDIHRAAAEADENA